MDMLGEVIADPPGAERFQRGVSQLSQGRQPGRPDRRARAAADLRRGGPSTINIGHLQQDRSIGAYVDVDEMVQKHFAIFGSTGAGKSSAVALILREIMAAQMDLRVLLIDPHNEYAGCFEDKAHVLRPGNLRLPYWLFNFDEIVEVVFGRRPDVDGRDRPARRTDPARQERIRPQQRRRPHQLPPDRARRRPLHRRHAGALPHGRPGRARRQPDGQAREPRDRRAATSG